MIRPVVSLSGRPPLVRPVAPRQERPVKFRSNVKRGGRPRHSELLRSLGKRFGREPRVWGIISVKNGERHGANSVRCSAGKIEAEKGPVGVPKSRESVGMFRQQGIKGLRGSSTLGSI